jgi:hypothetical protein
LLLFTAGSFKDSIQFLVYFNDICLASMIFHPHSKLTIADLHIKRLSITHL